MLLRQAARERGLATAAVASAKVGTTVCRLDERGGVLRGRS